MQTNPSWKDWFVFSKKERRAFAVLLFFLVGFIVLLTLQKPTEIVAVQNLVSAEKFSPDDRGNASESSSGTFEKSSTETYLFPFDPNTADAGQLAELGLREKTIRTLVNYRAKGGHFSKPDDLRKIYGLQADEAERLIPYVKIMAPSQSFSKKKETGTFYSDEKKTIRKIDINTATAEDWKTLPAIGDVLSRRIVKFRDSRGGFTSLEQVKDTYGLSDSAYQAILPYLSFSKTSTTDQHFSQRKININTASLSELKQQTGLPPEVGEAIVIYRNNHGKYASLNDLHKIVFINDSVFQKITPFLTVE